VRGLLVLATVLPERAAYWCGRRLGDALYPLSSRFRRVALRNLEIAFGERLSSRERRSLCRRNLRFIGQTLFESLRLWVMNGDDIRERVSLKHEERLREAYARGRGVILLSAHFGNWEWMGARILQDYPLVGVARPTRSPATWRLVTRLRERMGARMIDSDDVRGALRALREGAVLVLLLDQNTAVNAVFVDFFGKPAATARGPAVLAARTGAAVVPAFSVRLAPGRYEVHFLPPHYVPQDAQGEALDAHVQAFTKIIEEWVARHPDHWLWIHDRWRNRPPEENN